MEIINSIGRINTLLLTSLFLLAGRVHINGVERPALLLRLVAETQLPRLLPEEATKRVIRSILKGLAHCHAKEIVHRDIKVGVRA